MGIIIDVDSHFMPKDAFEDQESQKRFGRRWPRFVFDAAKRSRVVFPERLQSLTPHQRSLPCSLIASKRHPGYYDSDERVAWLDQAGIDMEVLIPSPASFAYDVEPEIGIAVCRSYNDAIGRILKRHPSRFIGLAVVPMQDPMVAIEELERAIHELNIHAPLVISNVNGRNLDEQEFWPFYERVEQLGVPMIIHGSRFERGGVLGMDRLDKMHLDNALGFMYEGTLAITSLILGGILDMYPRLKIGVMETGAGYLPYLMDRLQEVYGCETLGGISPYSHHRVRDLIRKPPEEYMNQFWVCFNVAAEHRSIPAVVERFGADRFMANSDFPHGLGGAGQGMAENVHGIAKLTEGDKEKILGLSGCALFGIDPRSRQQMRPAIGL